MLSFAGLAVGESGGPMSKDKYPWMQFFAGEWMADPALSKCSPATRGIWIDVLCAMHLDDRRGEVFGTVESLARMARCSIAEMTVAVDELSFTKTADVTFCNNDVTLINRRMKRAYSERENTKVRVKKHRCNADVTRQKSEVRSQKSESEKKEEIPPPLSLSLGKAGKAYQDMVQRVYNISITNTNAIVAEFSKFKGKGVDADRIVAVCSQDAAFFDGNWRPVDEPAKFVSDFVGLEQAMKKAAAAAAAAAAKAAEYEAIAKRMHW
jgi:hypothetical protein